MQTSNFIAKLEQEAARQAELSRRRWLPPQLDSLTSFIGNYPWQVLLVISGVTALVVEIVTRWRA